MKIRPSENGVSVRRSWQRLAAQDSPTRRLLNLYAFYGDDLKVECPKGSGNRITLFEVAREITRRLSGIFARNEQGQRPVYGGTNQFQDDPHWCHLILFYEYFHGDNGAGLGAVIRLDGPAALLRCCFAGLLWSAHREQILKAEKGNLADYLVPGTSVRENAGENGQGDDYRPVAGKAV